ncbi:hypothetical protein [Aestuariispira insulae]|uniref:Uncharacterized protein n=1 Tax=Aestuariispira insulae TaxID=1461337 RepID=A0A3D9HRV8_9PROT|nr:hypothetical protein [Aestuariispira insulae]RED52189.1 hypothetical protein DFP90_102207 [Aestuariispira insulae]
MEIVITQGDRIVSGPRPVSHGQRLELPGGNVVSGLPKLPFEYHGQQDAQAYMIRRVIRKTPPYDRRTQRPGGLSIQISGEICEITQTAADRPVEEIRAELTKTVKAIAQAKILAIIPIWKQINLTARAAQLAMKGSLSPEEQAEWDAGEAIWNRVAPIRAASDLIEAEIAAANIPQMRDIVLESDHRWPQ